MDEQAEQAEQAAGPAEPVAPLRPGLPSRLRWLLAGGAVVAAVAIVGIALAVLGSRPVPAALTYIPRDSDVVVELRPDLPGDQIQRVGNLLAHFPGFKDQSNLAHKLDESLARITSTVSNGSVDYGSAVKPWLAGPLIAADVHPGPGPASSQDLVVVFSTDGTVDCDPFTGASTGSEPYRGLVIHTPARAPAAACVIDGRQALVGTLGGVKAAIDAHLDHAAVDGAAAYRAARDRLSGDQLATVYVADRQVVRGLVGALPSGMPTARPELAAAAAALPEWAIVGLRAEDGALVADIVSGPFDANAGALLGIGLPGGSAGAVPSLLTPPPAHLSKLASVVPANTAVLGEVHGAGVAVRNLLARLGALAGVGGSGGPADPLSQLDAALGALGGGEGFLGWVGDAGIVVLTDGAGADGGVVLLAPDDATAAAKADQIRGLLSLVAAQAGMTVSDTTIDGTTVTLVDLGDASELAGRLGLPATGVPVIAPGTRIVISLAAHGSTVILGSGESFARQLIETTTGSSLADQASYRSAVSLATARNSGQLYVAVGRLRALAETAIPAAERARYESDVKPYLEPFDALLETVSLDDSGLHLRLVVTVK
jgi:hypothetical protein